MLDAGAAEATGGASLTVGAVTLYRVVDSAELASILKLGRFSASPNGDTVKRFVDNLPDAKALRTKFAEFFGGEQHIVRGEVELPAFSGHLIDAVDAPLRTHSD
jgi:hypothetical protein